MSAGDVTALREAVLKRLRTEGLTMELRDFVANTLVEVWELKAAELTAGHGLTVHLVTKALESKRCEVCHGALVGSELGYDTCGHCGGRSLVPAP